MECMCPLHPKYQTVLFCRSHKEWYCELCLKSHNKCSFPVHYSEILEEKTKSNSGPNSAQLIEDINSNIEQAELFRTELSNLINVVESKLCVADIGENHDETPKTDEDSKIKEAIKFMSTSLLELNITADLLKIYNSMCDCIAKKKLEITRPKPICNGCSSIIDVTNFNTISNWIDPAKVFKFELLFRATRDGFACKEFHKLCDGIAPTLVVLRTDKDKVIGGYSVLKWKEEGEYNYVDDPSLKCFLFSITDNEKYSLKSQTYAISNSSKQGPKFGGGHDLEIVDNCDKVENQYSQIGFSYEYTKGHAEFYGAEKFKVVDYEVFKVDQ